jgi:diaminohydroxyphosphoribosylaminopyrimidine deaminase / 5-amino-6-(5-phosphoribosylamino)uracil reductase
VLGDGGRGMFHLPGLTKIADKKMLHLIEARQIGADLRLKFNQGKT